MLIENRALNIILQLVYKLIEKGPIAVTKGLK